MKRIDQDSNPFFKWYRLGFRVPMILIGIFLVIFGILLYFFYHFSRIEQAKISQILTERIVRNIELKLRGNLDFIQLIATERSEGVITVKNFQSHVSQYLSDHPEFINLTWVDSDYIIQTVCPLESNAHIIGFHIELPEPKRAARLARDSKECVYTKPFEAIQGEPSFEAWVPVYKGKRFLGLLSGVYSCTELLKLSLPFDKLNNANISLVDENNITLTVYNKANINDRGFSFQSPLNSLRNNLYVKVLMRPDRPSWIVLSLIFLGIFLLSGLLFSLSKIKRVIRIRNFIHEELLRSNTSIKNVNLELYKTKKNVEESEEMYRMLFDSINDAVFISEPDEDRKSLRYIKVNDVACQRLGYTQDELLSMAPFDINSEKNKPNIPFFIAQILEQKQALIETEHLTKDGRIIPVEINTRVTEFKGRIIFHSIVRDITERKQNELRIKEKTDKIEAQNIEYQKINEVLNFVNEELTIAKNRAEASEISLIKKNEELENTVKCLTDLESRLQFALLAGKLGTWDWDIQAGSLLWSDSSKKMFGLPVDSEMDYERFINTIIPEDRDVTHNIVWNALNEKRDYSCDFRVQWSDGSLHWISSMGRGIYDSSGTPVRMIGVAMEITDRKQIELALEHSYKLMSYIIEHNPSAIAVFDKELRYIYVSQRYINDYNVKESNIIGKYHYEIFPNLPEKFKDAHQKALHGEILRADDDPFYHQDGSTDWTRWECRPWFEANGKIGGIIIYTELITDRIRQKLELISAKEKAVESDRLKTAFLQNMSHEIRTPMNAIIGFSELLSLNFNNKQKLERFSGIITQRCNDLLDIINDLLEIAKIEAGQLPVKIQKCNIRILLDELATFFEEYLKKQKKQHISLYIGPGKVEEDIWAYTDKVKLKQIFINLIGNAVKFTNKGSIEVGYSIDNEQFITFYVKDTGIGIAKDKQQLIFERFTQVDNGSHRLFGGTGLGLSIVSGLLNILGGSIWLDSEPGKGSSFYFTIPRDVSNTREIEQDKSEIISSTIQHLNKSILIVEDDQFNAEYIKEVLKNKGLNLIFASSGNEAVEMTLTHMPDLILMDIRLPDISGFDAIKKIKGLKPDIRIIAQTAYALEEDRVKAMEAGCIDYISKPLKSELFLTMINKHLK